MKPPFIGFTQMYGGSPLLPAPTNRATADPKYGYVTPRFFGSPRWMRSTPAEWELSWVLTLRTSARCRITRAECGSVSETWMPGTLVGMARRGPPNGVFGFGSQLS